MKKWQLGPSALPNGLNFTLFAKEAKKVELVTPSTSYLMNEELPSLFTLFLPDIDELTYRYRIDGIEIIDPWAKELLSPHTWGEENFHPWSLERKRDFDFEGVKKPRIPKSQLIIYELHVRGFTKTASVSHPGTFLGLVEKLPYLASLGVNALELLPIQEFNECEIGLVNPFNQKKLSNFWGYSSVSFFALMNRYGVKNSLEEFKTLVKEAHKLGLEIILDVVFNHTAEGNEKGPTYHFKKMGEELFYIKKEGHFLNDSGCGNTIRQESALVQENIIDALRFLSIECQVDGFRFDLATILTKHDDRLMERIIQDPFLSDVKLIAEPWDVAHFRLGSFADLSPRFSEWNSSFRDCVRRFMVGDPGVKGGLATRISGSQDIFSTSSPLSSINFVTCHDGFTLHDLVAYNQKHNLSNGEDNRDGSNNNISYNCGREGETTNAQINVLRKRKIHTFLAILLLSKGIPMLNMGDEIGHSKKGNNNSWAHDDHMNEFSWDKVAHSELIPFIQKIIALRKTFPALYEDRFLTDDDVSWLTDFTKDDKILVFLLQKKLFIALNGNTAEKEVFLPSLCFIDALTEVQVDTASINLAPYECRILKVYAALETDV